MSKKIFKNANILSLEIFSVTESLGQLVLRWHIYGKFCIRLAAFFFLLVQRQSKF